jgi:hypothetical protein
MDHGKKLLSLLGVPPVRGYSEPTTYEELMETGGYWAGLFEQAFAQGEVQSERISGEAARILAEIFQQEARRKYGFADAATVRRLVSETFETEANEEMERQMALLREGIGRSGLDTEQQLAFLKHMETFKDMFIDLICAEAARLKLIPLENVNEISLSVADMMKEDAHADQISGN